MTGGLKVLIVGGYGTFGGRLAVLLSAEPELTLLIAGRSIGKAREWCARHQSKATFEPTAFDRSAPIAPQLDTLAPDWVVDASGPFQLYSDDPYGLVRACIARRIHYCDLADGAAFVEGVGILDDEAKRAGAAILSGVSSFPVLTAAVVRALASDLERIDTVEGGIAPSPFAGVGENVIRAIASYAGQEIPMVRGGGISKGRPLTETRRYTIAPPGRIPLRSTLFSLVDVPDLLMIPKIWPEVKTVWVGAGPVPAILHRLLIACAWAVRLSLVPRLDRLAPLMTWASSRLRWGEHRGGMYVELTGRDRMGLNVRRSWHLLAEGEDGPLIPSMAAAIIIKRALAGRPPTSGARPAMAEIELEEYDAMFRGRTIYWGTRSEAEPTDLYQRLLGSAWNGLDEPIRMMHGPNHTTASGAGEVVRGTSLGARLIAMLFRFPPSAADVPVTVAFGRGRNGGERWTRAFGLHGFSSSQAAGRGRSRHLLVERFGPFAFAMALVTEGGRLKLVLRRWSVLGIAFPLALGPWTRAQESVIDGRFHFDVEIGHRLTGSIVRYRGWLVPDQLSTPFAFPQARAAV
jgi:hypothetical protein